MKKLLLINPVRRKSGYLLSKISRLPPLSLAYVAAVTPSNWEIKIWDENFTPFVFEEADLVGITAFTTNINRAYEIARMYREKKIKVILGGIHASMLPDEGLRYADSIVIGEVEGIWDSVIRDFESNNLQPKYRGPRLDLSRYTVTPRRDLIHPDYLWNSIQTSRGCPFSCHFCSVSNYLGREYRQRNSEDVLKELDQIPGEFISFLDDNLIGYGPESKRRAKAIFEGMIKSGARKKWWMQTSINAAEDEKVLELAAQSGCLLAFIGFETIDRDALKGMKKGSNLKIGTENYKKVVDTFHKYGIGVYGAFVLGNDFESPEYYKKLAKYLVHSGIDIVQISILTPLPGTDLMEQLEREDRLVHKNFPEDWEKYRFSYVVHEPRGIHEETIYRGDNYIKNSIYSFPAFPYRMIKSLFNLKSATNFGVTREFNQALKKAWRNSQYYAKYPHTL
ncbi:MAG: B12-binding domain-containing radical SAM protein [Deltaproteobacteria bacterium HGW-Deltaproteobacteria-21]|nr:MAG: B12-binding domain-containing radical SAM protein [Deltaproteobacteria bacterium HGW-Deltaproteobacteria-21]